MKCPAKIDTAMADHTERGARIDELPLLAHAANGRPHRHDPSREMERHRLSARPGGRAIPLEGRITAVADAFDALSNKRPYKSAFPLEQCFAMMEEGRGNALRSAGAACFLAAARRFLRVRRECMETAPATPIFDMPLPARLS